jgi:hypothetical protein
MFNFETREGRVEFIHNNESSLYEGKNIDGEQVIVMLQKGEGMDVKTRHHNKMNWWEIIEYDAEGFQVGVTYEKT